MAGLFAPRHGAGRLAPAPLLRRGTPRRTGCGCCQAREQRTPLCHLSVESRSVASGRHLTREKRTGGKELPKAVVAFPPCKTPAHSRREWLVWSRGGQSADRPTTGVVLTLDTTDQAAASHTNERQHNSLSNKLWMLGDISTFSTTIVGACTPSRTPEATWPTKGTWHSGPAMPGELEPRIELKS